MGCHNIGNNGELTEAKYILKGLYQQNENRKVLIPKFVNSGLLTISEKELEKILSE